jgi:hypothetical protein
MPDQSDVALIAAAAWRSTSARRNGRGVLDQEVGFVAHSAMTRTSRITPESNISVRSFEV